MIFVSLGTQDKPFTRLLSALEEIEFFEEVVVQAGYTQFKSSKMTIKGYLDKDEFDLYMKQASLVITHGGVGSIVSALSNGKKVIACPRLAKYGEHTNDHQLQIVEVFEKKGYLLAYRDGDDLNEVIAKSGDFIPKSYTSNNDCFVAKLKDYIG